MNQKFHLMRTTKYRLHFSKAMVSNGPRKPSSVAIIVDEVYQRALGVWPPEYNVEHTPSIVPEWQASKIACRGLERDRER